VLDVGAWDNSVALNSPGQSGDPASPHYKDLYARWLDGEVFPLAFSRAKVEAETKARILLKPVQ
jgi:penicillin G amidase